MFSEKQLKAQFKYSEQSFIYTEYETSLHDR